MKYLLLVATLALALGLVLYGCTEEPELLQAPTAPTSGPFTSVLGGSYEILTSPADPTDPAPLMYGPGGTPGLPEGTALFAAGEGLLGKVPATGTIELTIPDPPIENPYTVELVLLYWEGHDTDPGTNMGPTDVVTVDGNPVTGVNIGGPTAFYLPYHSATYRADITSLNLVEDFDGTNPSVRSISIPVTGMDFDKNNGMGIVVIIKEEGVPLMTVQMMDGNDLAYWNFADPIDHCEKLTFTFPAATFERDAELCLSASSVENPRPTTLHYWIGSTEDVINSPFNDKDESEWDTYKISEDVVNFKIPAGETSVSVQPVSEGHSGLNGDLNPASIAWLNASLAIQNHTSKIGDKVWLDGNCADADGCQGLLEPGVPGVTVELYKCDPTPVYVEEMVTDALGNYLFDELVPGDYAVKFILPTGYEFVTQNNCGSTPNNDDSDADETTGMTICTTLDPGEADLTWDAGLCMPTASIGDYVWCDEDCDGCQDPGEPAISGITVNLYKGASSTTIFATDVTDANGKYLFEDLVPGEYYLEFILKSHYKFTDANVAACGDANDSDADPTLGRTAPTTLVSGENDLDWDAGMIPLGRIGDLVWLDENEDGCQDAGEPGVPNVTVHLFECEDDGTPTTILAGTATTDPNGIYVIDDVSPCVKYRLQFVKPTSGDYNFSPKDATACDDDNDSDADDSGYTDCFDLVANCDTYDLDASWDAGLTEPPTGCRLTGGCNDKSVNVALGESAEDVYTCGGQAGAPTALQPQPSGEWTHTQKRGPSGTWTFHAGTASAPPGTEITWIECMDPGWCVQARHAPAKQLDFVGVGTFKNMKASTPVEIASHVIVGDSHHWFEVNIDDLGEPGKAGKVEPPAALCDVLGYGRNGGTDLAECDCPDFYRFKVYEGPDNSYPVMYEVYGYIDGGNFQIHPLTGRDRKEVESKGGGGKK